ncbi:hypothetical protein [Trinickia sp.]|uniref:hypothetical protein n=1 Tax=Trinickia sp. TaxID=2571163 RepID=UPI003F80E2E6
MNEQKQQEPADPVERADARRTQQQQQRGDVKVTPEGVEQRSHGSIDATQTPKGKPHPEKGAYEPVHDKVVPDTDPNASPRGKDNLGA